LKLEFDSDETIDHFTSPWWARFHSAVDDSDAAAAALVDGRLAIVTGLVGLDCEHSCHTELHPVWAMSIRVDESSTDETWAMFVRNWGDEGYCSQNQHYVDFFGNVFKVRLPWRPGATSGAIVSTNFLTNSTTVSGPAVEFDPNGTSVLVTFWLPAPEAGARVNGQLQIHWEMPIRPVTTVVATAPLGEVNVARQGHAIRTDVLLESGGVGAYPNAESRMTSLVQTLSSQNQEALRVAAQRVASPDEIPLGAPAQTGAVAMPIVTAAFSGVPAVRSVFDPAKAARDAAAHQALLTAFGGTIPIPGAPTAPVLLDKAAIDPKAQQ
jgi:hypothetical protein